LGAATTPAIIPGKICRASKLGNSGTQQVYVLSPALGNYLQGQHLKCHEPSQAAELEHCIYATIPYATQMEFNVNDSNTV